MSEALTDAARQLAICNACRYCEGYCAVYPALERRRELSEGDLVQLANLCHDCRACLYACMYAPPHEFAINVPLVLATVRRESYGDLAVLGTPGGPPILARWRRPLSVFVLVGGLVIVIAALSEGIGALVHAPAQNSPYGVVPYGALLGLGLACAGLAVVAMAVAARRYWRRTGGGAVFAASVRPVLSAILAAATLRNLSGGGEACTYPEESPSPARRVLHGGLVVGFAACLGATIAAGIEQDFLAIEPPYAVGSVPVLLGLLGGVLLVVTTVGLGALKARADPEATDGAMAVADYGLLAGLFVLGLGGLLVLALRDTGLFGLALTLHLAAVLTCFLLAPWTKFVHGLYRALALVRDAREQATAGN